jgi:NAD(P)-dependent dehydrogenase (short-subunit alcohol dehydrogenase family)
MTQTKVKPELVRDAQVAVVTGGSGGIGTAIMHALHDAGVYAISLDVSPPSDKDIPWIKCNLCDDTSVAAAIAEVARGHQRIDLVIHAAGVSREGVVWKLTVEDWDLIHTVNLRGAFLLLRHTIPVMRQNGGRIVLIGSINGSRGKFGTSAYAASKAGLLGLAKSVARETGRFRVLVNVVEPGWVRTALTDALPEKARDAAVAESPLGEMLEPSDVAAAVLFLCGPGASHITGQILRVDGGQYLGAS